jgi:GNAT superfamily N-acetyltransferase
MPEYRIRRVDGSEEADVIQELHNGCFEGSAPPPETDAGHWWLAYDGFDPVAFAQLTTSKQWDGCGYLARSGVRSDHRGRGLQLRLIRAREARARELGWQWIVTDTNNNIASANTLIRAGYRLYQPRRPWSFSTALYWRKELQ